MTQVKDWERRLASVIAERVKGIRKDRRMSAQDLADATAQLGHPIKRSVIANLENGRRDSIGIAEVLVLARALDVPPLALVFPLGRAPEAEVFPGASAPTWDAARWFTGEKPLPDDLPGQEWADPERWAGSAVAQFRGHDDLVAAFWRVDDGVREAVERGEIPLVKAYLEARDAALDQLHRYRQRMRRDGIEPPPVPAGVPLMTDEGVDFRVVEDENWGGHGER
jgi:transcriptional regulator with XRE-family HTH domain